MFGSAPFANKFKKIHGKGPIQNNNSTTFLYLTLSKNYGLKEKDNRTSENWVESVSKWRTAITWQ